MTEKEQEQRRKSLSVSGGVCAICGKSLNAYGFPQYAHKIANTITNRKIYGSFFIDHYLNGAMVCSLKCNDAMNIGNNKGKVLALLADIVIQETKDF